MIAKTTSRRLALSTAVLVVIGGVTALAGDVSGQGVGWIASGVLRPSAIVASRYVAPDGSIKANVAITLSGGKIKSVGPAKRLAVTEGVVRHEGAVICPGLIDVRSKIGAFGQLIERAHSIDPAASAVDSLDRNHRDFRAALRSGVTTAVLSPGDNNLISGVAVVVKTAGLEGAILRDDGPLMLALGSTVWQYDRAPTSRIGSLTMLRHALDDARRGQGHKRITDFVQGRLSGMVVCDEPMDVSAALRTLGSGDAKFSIVHNSDEHSLADELSGSGRIVIVGPYTFSMPQRRLSVASALSSAGVTVAFAGGMPVRSGDGLRVTATLAVLNGMDSAAARRAMTITPARVAGVDDRVGAIRVGMDADFVVFSDDPLRLDSAVLAVYVDGLRVYHADADPIEGSR